MGSKKRVRSSKKTGKVALVGAGPGDAGLLTLRGLELLSSAEVVVCDRLVNPKILEFAAMAEKVINVGKDGRKITSEANLKQQKKTNQLLVELARKGYSIVRLKGGDPFVFGRGGEEAQHLSHAGIPFEVVPGVTAASGACAYAGIPVTDRYLASSVLFVTGHEAGHKSKNAVDWKRLGMFEGTLVVYMGTKSLSSIVRLLIEGGRDGAVPACIIERGTFPDQRIIEGTLKTIVQKAEKAKVRQPSLFLSGAVVSLRKSVNWFEKRALHGKKVVITRARHQMSSLSVKLEQCGAQVIEMPVIDIQPPKSWRRLDASIEKIDAYDWLVFTSVNGVEHFFWRLIEKKRDVRCLAHLRFAVIGDATKDALFQWGIIPDLMPAEYTSRSLVQALHQIKQIKGKHFLLPRTDIAPEYLPKELILRGGRVTQVTAYRTVRTIKSRKALRSCIDSGEADYVTFTSSATVRNFFQALPSARKGKIKPRLISIGPVTSETIRSLGNKVHLEAAPHTTDGIVEAVLSDAGRQKKEVSGKKKPGRRKARRKE